jgi:hypothetical protein
MQRVILLEFNELCPALLDRWMDAGKLPNFRHLYQDSHIYVTDPDEREAPLLEPWIQWYSLHTGIPYREHKVFHLTDGPAAGHTDIWNRLLSHGKRVANFSSMNARGLSDPKAVFLPDPWCRSEAPFPQELSAFQDFVSSQVQEYSNADRRAGLADAVRFVGFLATHGLRASTVRSVLSQLWDERRTKGAVSWKRATLLDKMLLDVFEHYYRSHSPDFATYFVNSTAHLQHSYWRCMAPHQFTLKPTDSEIARYGDAVLFGYQQMDELVGRFLTLGQSRDVTLMFATALSQQPFVKHDAAGGQNFYRPRNVEHLLEALGVRPLKTFPVMTHQYLLHFASAAQRSAAERTLASLLCDGRQVFQFDSATEPMHLYFGCQLRTRLDAKARITRTDAPFDRAFFDLFYRIEEIKSGRHHPDGCLWIRTGKHVRHAGKVSILDVVPTILGMYDISAPDLRGMDLLRPQQVAAA